MASKVDPVEAVISFTEQVKYMMVGSVHGYTVFSLKSVDEKLKKTVRHTVRRDVFIIERLKETCACAIVAGNQRKLVIYNLIKEQEMGTFSYNDTILAVKLCLERVVVCTEDNLFIHNRRDLFLMHTIQDTPPNSTGLIALSPFLNGTCYLAYPGSCTTGNVEIYDVIKFRSIITIPAHDTPLAALAFSPNAEEIATASDSGTIIRVFSLSDGEKLYEFRRGLKRCVTMACLAFSTCGEYLVSSSNTETVHIFRLNRNAGEANNTDEKSTEWLGYLGSTATNYLLPAPISGIFTQGRPFASIHLPTADVKRMCAITKIEGKQRLLIASQDGFLYVYSVPSEEGGVPEFITKHDLFKDYYYQELKDKMTKTSAVSENPASVTSSSTDDDEKPSTSKNCEAAAAEIEDEFVLLG